MGAGNDTAMRNSGSDDATRVCVVRTNENKCKRCYSCIRHCPAKAIRVEKGQAWVMEERCIACGNCVRYCAQNAKQIRDGIAPARTLLSGSKPVVLIIAPSFPVAFADTAPGRVVTAARELGFAQVMEVAFGAELVSAAYRKLISSLKEGPVIATPCPAVVQYVEKYHPQLIPALAPIVSPMVALSRYIKKKMLPDARVVFAGPCVAKKQECSDPTIEGLPEAALTFAELRQMFIEADIDFKKLEPSAFDGPAANIGRIFPVSGGLLRTAALDMDVVHDDIVVTEGYGHIPALLEAIETGRTRARFFDILFCEGCINGPILPQYMSDVERKECVTHFMRNSSEPPADGEEYMREIEAFAGNLFLMRGFADERIELPFPSEEDITAVLLQTGKHGPDDELNCGACGYPSCREKAIAVCHGIAETEMCLPYMIDRITEEYNKKKNFLLMASHQMRSPLVAIQSVIRVLTSGATTGNPEAANTLLNQAYTRSQDMLELVNDILDLARSDAAREDKPEYVDPLKELAAIVSLIEPNAAERGISIVIDAPPETPHIFIVRKSLNHVLTNLVDNAVKYSKDNTSVNVYIGVEGDSMRFEVADSGIGIPEREQQNIFKEFFRANNAKMVRTHGTGLGLSIVKHIVQNQGGTIDFTSRENHGTTFTALIPFEPKRPQENEEDKEAS